MIVQLAAENTISELVRAVIVPFAHSLAVFFLLGAAIGLVFHGLLSFSRPEKSGGDAQPLAVRLTLMPIFVIFWVMFVLVLVILLVTWPLSAMKLTPAPVDSVSDCVWVILVVSVVFTMGTMIVRHTLAEVVCLWLATTCVTLLTATLPFYGSVHQTADKSARAGGAAVFTPIAQGLLRSPSVPASTWLEAQAILARNGDLASRSDASKDFLNRRLYSLLGCPHLPTEPGKPPLGVSKTRWRKDFEADLRLKQQACTLLTSRANPGLMNSIYVVSLFTLGVFIGSLAERRSLPKHYFHHPVHVIDRIAFCGLGVGAVVALILW
ncbi:MAG: hypothetical protein HOV83_24730 [Catenulispora sp.]|nr:hypothetical protein [Catenulispora sp.]